MPPFITQTGLNLIKKFPLLLIFCLIAACNDDARSRLEALESGSIELPSGKKLTVFVAQTDKAQETGLSGLPSKDFSQNEGLIFPADEDKLRQFWMPDTHFNLDIIFLTKDLYVLDVHKNIEHFPKREPKGDIPLSKAVYSRHVLEIRADSPLADEIRPGMVLKWSGDRRLLRTK